MTHISHITSMSPRKLRLLKKLYEKTAIRIDSSFQYWLTNSHKCWNTAQSQSI